VNDDEPNVNDMINDKLIHPRSIVVVGGSGDRRKPGGKVLENLLRSGFRGELYVVNPRGGEVQGVPAYREVSELPQVDLAILAVAAKYTLPAVEILARDKGTRAFIILSAGFGEESSEGAALEKEIVRVVERYDATLIGPNCIGVITPSYSGVFTTPAPAPDPEGVTLVSGSGATAVFIMEAGITMGLTFASVFSVGNSAQNGVEEVLAYLDEHFDPATSSKVILLYMESIRKPRMLLRHAASLVRKGCRIAAVKAGVTDAGSRAASSHTGAMAGSDEAAAALFRKAGLVRCHSRQELVTVAGVMRHPLPRGRRFAVITHAGGPAVMLTDTLAAQGLEVPPLQGPAAEELRQQLFPGSSVRNPIDFLATGTAEQLDAIIEACDNAFDNIDAMVVIFGSPGLFPVDEVYDVLDRRMRTSRKPIYPVLPSVINVRREIEAFIARGHVHFSDEVVLGRALGRVLLTPTPAPAAGAAAGITLPALTTREGYLPPDEVHRLLREAGIPVVEEKVCETPEEALSFAMETGFPVVMKAVGLLHKSDAGGVITGITTPEGVEEAFDRLTSLENVTAVLVQPMVRGYELFAGVKREGPFGHLILAGLGGIFVETLRDYAAALTPLSSEEALQMIRSLRAYPLFKGLRGKKGISEERFAGILVNLSRLAESLPTIAEMDLNPLIAEGENIVAVDARIRLEKSGM